MKLLTFAHRAEAQAFHDKFDLKSCGENLFLNQDFMLLVTGEGLFEAMSECMKVLTLHPEISEVYNLGIVGNLGSQKLDEVASIRSVYAHDSSSPLFKSFTTSDPSASIDLLSFSQRVKDSQTKEKLALFAPLVDREAWAIGFVANRFKRPFYVFKYISDDADENTQCHFIKDSAFLYSQKLLSFFLNFHSGPQNEEEEERQLPEGLYFTRAQKLLYFKYQNLLETLGKEIPSEEIKKIMLLDITPKQKTGQLLNLMKELINPMTSIMQEELGKFLKPFTQIGAQVKTDNELESSELLIQYKIRNQSDIDRLKRGLELFDIKQFERFFEGEF